MMVMDDLQRWERNFVPRTFRPGYIILSYFISFAGSWTTLEILNRRTAIRGVYNWLHLLAASISMGGIGIWCMHFIGNAAIILGDGQKEIQPAYSPGFTALSFFLPVVVLSIAFWVVGSNGNANKVGVIIRSVVAGLGVCGMHYLGQAGITNYDCVYEVGYVIGAAAIAVFASGVALAIFFLTNSSFIAAWWRRILCANVLAVAVSGMHWLGSVGTRYRLKLVASNKNQYSSTLTVTIAIVLSVVACLALFTLSFFARRRVIRLAKRAQQVVLAVAIFNHEGKLLVTPEGQLPAHKITNSWLERTADDTFSTSHAVFLWMFRTSRNWASIRDLLRGMRAHIQRAGIRGRFGSDADNNLLNDEGIPIEDYSIVFRELFCLAARDLAGELNLPLQKLGVLYDEIVPTGLQPKDGVSKKSVSSSISMTSSITDVERDASLAKGQLLFLVSRVGRKEAQHLEGAGFRFANSSSVIPIIAQSLQIIPKTLAHCIEDMHNYAYEPHILSPGVHLAFFAIRASLVRRGFDVLACKDAKNLLPTSQVKQDYIADWQIEYLEKMDSLSVSATLKALKKASNKNNPSLDEQQFAKNLLSALEALKEEMKDPLFNDALLIAKPVKAPCSGPSEASPPGIASLITFRIILPIGSRAPGTKLVFVPLPFFKAQQHAYNNSPAHEVFARQTYREFAAFLNLSRASSVMAESHGVSGLTPGQSNALAIRKSRHGALMGEALDRYGTPVDLSEQPDRGPSKVGFWDKRILHHPKRRGENSSEVNLVDKQYSDGRGLSSIRQDLIIDVEGSESSKCLSPPRRSEQIEMVVLSTGREVTSKISKEDEEAATFVDFLFTTTVEKRLR